MSSIEKDIQELVLSLASVEKIGPVKLKTLLGQVTDPLELIDWDIARYCAVPGINERLAVQIKQNLNLDTGRKYIEWAEKNGFSVLTLADSDYPGSLRKIYDPPPFLFLKGKYLATDQKSVAIVGSRNASEYGRTTATKLAMELARNGITVVSGMAIGVDSSAHRGALAAGGRTLAVLGSGVDVIYPRSNKRLYQEVSEQGAVISEFLPGVGPNPPHFPRRNRVISGLSQAIIVVEAGQKSGALLTADIALSQERTIFAIPGQLTSKNSAGTNELIKAGAHLLSSIDDIFSVLPELKNDYIIPQRRVEVELEDGEGIIYNLLSETPRQFDSVVRECGFMVNDVTSYLLSLELRGLIRQLSGKRFITN